MFAQNSIKYENLAESPMYCRTSGVGAGDTGDAAASPSKFFRQIWAKSG